MHPIKITKTHRIVVSRNTAIYQVKESDRWENTTRKTYDGNWKGNLVEDMKAEYKAWKRNKTYQEAKLQPYH